MLCYTHRVSVSLWYVIEIAKIYHTYVYIEHHGTQYKEHREVSVQVDCAQSTHTYMHIVNAFQCICIGSFSDCVCVFDMCDRFRLCFLAIALCASNQRTTKTCCCCFAISLKMHVSRLLNKNRMSRFNKCIEKKCYARLRALKQMWLWRVFAYRIAFFPPRLNIFLWDFEYMNFQRTDYYSHILKLHFQL